MMMMRSQTIRNLFIFMHYTFSQIFPYDNELPVIDSHCLKGKSYSIDENHIIVWILAILQWINKSFLCWFLQVVAWALFKFIGLAREFKWGDMQFSGTVVSQRPLHQWTVCLRNKQHLKGRDVLHCWKTQQLDVYVQIYYNALRMHKYSSGSIYLYAKLIKVDFSL